MQALQFTPSRACVSPRSSPAVERERNSFLFRSVISLPWTQDLILPDAGLGRSPSSAIREWHRTSRRIVFPTTRGAA